MESLEVQRHAEVNAQVLTVAGEVDMATAGRLREHLGDAVLAQPRKVVVDLAAVSFLDSVALGVLVGALKRSRAAGVQLSLAGLQEPVTRVLRITGLISAFHVFPDVQAALEG